MKKHILIIEDEVEVANSIAKFLVKSGFEVSHLEQGELAVNFCQTHTVDLVLLDIMLPGIDGLAVCKQLRTISDIPIFMLTACTTENQRLQGLELGADDYISKPFSAPELVLRIQNFLKRFGDNAPQQELVININEYTASFDGKSLDLTKTELELITLFKKIS